MRTGSPISRSHTASRTQRCVLASWCTIIPGSGARSRLMRCLPRRLSEHGAGILWIDGKVERLLTPGSYAYWKFNRNVAVEAVDLRLQAVEVTGQDILTRDKIGLRLNLSATWRYVDVLKAFTQLAKPAEHLYRESARPRIARRRDAKVRLPEPKEMSIAAEGASFAPSPCIPRHV